MRRLQCRITCDQPTCSRTAEAPHGCTDALALFQRTGWFVAAARTGDICPACLHHGAKPAPNARPYGSIQWVLQAVS